MIGKNNKKHFLNLKSLTFILKSNNNIPPEEVNNNSPGLIRGFGANKI